MGMLQWLLILAALVVFSVGFVAGAEWRGIHLTRRRLEDD